MKMKYASFRLFFLTALIVYFFPGNALLGMDLYVSITGSDEWSGTLPEANASLTDGPFKTLERARQEIRNLPGQPNGGVTVFIRGGQYARSGTFELTSSDSGTVESPVVWRNYPEEDVFFRGGMDITNFAAINDTSILARIAPEYREHILQADLKALGITTFPQISPTGPKMDFLFKGQSMPISRFPNEGWTKIKFVPKNNIIAYAADIADHVSRWSDENEIWLQGYFYYDWSSSYQAVDSISSEKRFIYLKPPLHHYGFRANQRFYFLNILEELDQPGEWLLDRQNGTLYFWPPEPINDGDAYLSMLDSTMILLNQTSHITIQGITFEGTYKEAIRVTGGMDNKIAGCTFRNIISNAVTISGGKRNGITGCDLYDLGAAGITLDGGDRLTLERADNYADNNHIHHFARIQKTYHPAISVRGVGQIVSHNLIHDAPHQGLNWSGNEHLIEFNEIHDVAQETGDVGAMYSGRNWTWRGNVIRYNYLHDIHGPGSLGAMGVYMDDALSGTTVYGNIFYKSSMAVLIGGGRDNIVQNNIFIKCSPSIHIDDRGHGWASAYIARGGGWHMYEKLSEVHYDQPPYSEYYPELATILDGDPALPAGNKIISNITYGGTWIDFGMYSWGGIVDFENNVITFIDPGFINLQNHNFQLDEDFYNSHPDFEYIPVDSMGLYISEYRPIITGVHNSYDKSTQPAQFDLNTYPNPFNNSTTIQYALSSQSPVKLAVYNVRGRQLAVLVDAKQPAGDYKILWSADRFSSGIYFVSLQVGDLIRSQKILFLK